MLKKTISAIALATLALGAQAADVVLKVAASAVPHAEILNFVKPQHKAQGVDLQVREFSDYIQPNAAAAVAIWVTSIAMPAVPLAAAAEPALKPNQPTHSIAAPTRV